MEVPRELPGPVLEGIERFNEGEFYASHEYLAEAWLHEPRRIRLLYQGILKVGIGFYHLGSGNWRGATRLLRSGIRLLEEFEPETLGINVSEIVRGCEQCLGELEELGPEGLREFHTAKIPRIRLV